MGKAAERRKAQRQKYLSGLAKANPEKFRDEWNKRMDSWLLEVRRRAGKFKDEDGKPIPPAFEVIQHAKRLLTECGIKETVLENCNSVDMLINECCKILSYHIDRRLYQLNVILKKK